MKKAIITFAILFLVSLFTAIVSFAVCGGELIKTGVEYGIEQYREYKAEKEFENNVMAMITFDK